MGKLNLGSTINVPKNNNKKTTSNQRGHKAAVSDAQLRTKALTVKFTPDEYKALRLYAMDKDKSHQDLIHAAVIKLIKK
jgi:hypothetical protein